jgi:thymidylate synthase
MTLRRTYFKSCIDELLWIWQKKSNDTHELNSKIWDSWADENGTIGKAYGYQLGVKHKYSDGWFDQVDRILKDLKENPASRRMLTNIFNHHDLSEMGLYPCAYSMTFNVSGDTLNAILNQRSQDMLTASNWNVCQYAILVHMMAQVSGLKAGELVHVIADCHIYDRHEPITRELILRDPRPAPRLWIDPKVKNFYDFTVDSFKLFDYNPHDFDEKIEVAI